VNNHQRKRAEQAKQLLDDLYAFLYGDDEPDTWDEAIFRQQRVANLLALMGHMMPDSRDWFPPERSE